MGCGKSKDTEDLDGNAPEGGEKKDKGKKEKATKAAKETAKAVKKVLENLEYKEFKNLGLPEIDSWFESVADVVDSVVEMGEACDTANEGVLKLLEAQEVIDAGVEDKTVKGIVIFLAKTTKAKGGKVSIEDGKLVVTSAEGCGAGWLIFDGVSKLVDALSTFVEEVPQLYPKLETFVEESKAMPDKIQSSATALGNPMKVPGIVKNGATNIKILGGVPGALKEAVTACTELLKTLKEALEAQTD